MDAPQFDGLNLAVENEDWVAIHGTAADFETLADVFMALARDPESSCRILDALPASFMQGSLGILLYRRGSHAPNTANSCPME